MMIQAFDVDHSGQITLDEFKEIILSELKD